MRVSLFVTCLVDQLKPSVGLAAAEVLRRAGCEVVFDERQTCCGQPAFNTGYRREARRLAQHFIEIFEASDAIVSPSGSCTAMAHHFRELFADDAAWHARALEIAHKTHELSSFLVNVLGREDVGASWRGRVAWHDACHALRDLGISDEPRQLLAKVRGLELVELPNARECCGFGGTFAVKYPEISVAIADQKIATIEQAQVRAVAAADASCLMHLGGRLARRKSVVQTLHLAEILAAQEN